MKWSIDAISRSMYKYCVGIKCVCACCRWRFIRFWRAKNTKMAKIAVPSSCHYLTQHSIVFWCAFRRVELNDWRQCVCNNNDAGSQRCQSAVLTHANTYTAPLTGTWIMDPKVLNASGNNIWHRIQIEFHVRRVRKKKLSKKTKRLIKSHQWQWRRRRLCHNAQLTSEWREKMRRSDVFRSVCLFASTHTKHKTNQLNCFWLSLDVTIEWVFFACLKSISTWITQARRKGQSSTAVEENQ